MSGLSGFLWRPTQKRDAAYHQGAAWGWLIGPYLTAHLRVYQDKAWAYQVWQGFAHHLADFGSIIT